MTANATGWSAQSPGPCLVVGSDGTIGAALLAALAAGGVEAVGTSRRSGRGAGRLRLDLRDDAGRWALPGRVGTAFICAGAASIADCGARPGETRKINVEGTLALARQLADHGAMIVYLSTNQVFNGDTPRVKAGSPLCPRSEYGRQKAEAETQLARLGAPLAIIRLTKVLPPAVPLLTGWRDALRAGKVIRPFHDMRMAPVGLGFVVEVLRAIGGRRPSDLPGVVQISAERDVTYEEVARHLARRVGAAETLIEPLSAHSAGIPSDATPQHTSLDTTTLREELRFKPADVWETIDRTVGE